ncbi:MAG TPA: DUF5763 domain-containing protein [Chitinophagaceae bacterium]|jgi:methylphosphotriester-DNA--protein-cysteine methyltransferase|nr:DUF5763 domain-containing protein [Chitinophagaceae bacterium]
MPLIRTALLLLFILSGFALSAQDYYRTPSGKKYHLASCRMVENVSQKITLQQAQEMGLDPCKICRPETGVQPAVPAAGKARGESTATVQCSGITKAGTRCRHRTRIANGYCFQHQPK